MPRVLFLLPWRGDCKREKNSVILPTSCHLTRFEEAISNSVVRLSPSPIWSTRGGQTPEIKGECYFQKYFSIFEDGPRKISASSGKACLLPPKLWFDHLSLTAFSWPCLSLAYKCIYTHKLALHQRCVWEKIFWRLCNWCAFVDVVQFIL